MLSQTLPDGSTYTLNPVNGQWTGQFGEFITRSKDRSVVEDKLKAHRLKQAPSSKNLPAAKPAKAPSLVTDIALQEKGSELTTRTVRLGYTDEGILNIDAVLTAHGWERKSRHDGQHLLAMDESTFDEADVAWLKARALEKELRVTFERAQARLADAFEAQADDLSRFVTVYDKDRVAYKPTERLFLEPSGGRMTSASSGQLNHAVVLPGLPVVATPSSSELLPEELVAWQDQPDGSMLRQEGAISVSLRLTPRFEYEVAQVTPEGERVVFTGRDLAPALRLGEATCVLAVQPLQAVWEHRSVWRSTNHYEGGSSRPTGDPLAWPVPVALQGVAPLKTVIHGRSQHEPLLAYLRQGPDDTHPVWTWAEGSLLHRTQTLAFTARTPAVEQIMSTVHRLLEDRETALAQVEAMRPVRAPLTPRNDSERDALQRLHQAALRAAYAAAVEQAEGEDPRPAPTAATQRALERFAQQAGSSPLRMAFAQQCEVAVASLAALPASAPMAPAVAGPFGPPKPSSARPRRSR